MALWLVSGWPALDPYNGSFGPGEIMKLRNKESGSAGRKLLFKPKQKRSLTIKIYSEALIKIIHCTCLLAFFQSSSLKFYIFKIFYRFLILLLSFLLLFFKGVLFWRRRKKRFNCGMMKRPCIDIGFLDF